MKKFNALSLARQAMIAAIYAALTLLLYPISFGSAQCRVSEALTVLPYFSPLCTLGLAVGCFCSNIIGGFGILDGVLGTLATAISGVLTSKIKNKYLAPLPPVIVNALIIPIVIVFATSPDNFLPVYLINVLQIGLGQLLSCYLLGLPLMGLIRKHGLERFLK
ncbi:MAG: QueT transporter family protein [Clostridiales bacterium]|mgnify:CR=1 FL=1|nr:QueT transporter family protein [Clostridiales bacterium]